MNPDPLAAMGLRDIHGAPAPEFWPPAPGWWLLAALVLAGLAWLAVRALAAWRRWRLRQQILAELDGLAACAPDQLAAQLSVLLRRIALMYFRRSEVAPLAGSAWLAFLDRTGGGGAFTAGPGRVLASAPYAVPGAASGDRAALLSLARRWVRHTVERRV